jgi:hypothetical protein
MSASKSDLGGGEGTAESPWVGGEAVEGPGEKGEAGRLPVTEAGTLGFGE